MLLKLWRFFCSVKLAVVLFVLILIPSVVGTVVQQNADDPGRYLEVYGPFWDSVFRWLGFYDIYHDPRFIVLLAMLALNTLACTVNRFRPRWMLAGMVMTHAGLLLILLGALFGAVFGVRGFMAIGEGETLDRIMVGRATGSTEALPFQVKLLDFILDRHEEPERKLVMLDMKTGEQRRRHLEPGGTVALSEPRWAGVLALLGMRSDPEASVRATRFLSNASVVTSLSEGPEPTGMRAVEVRLRGEGIDRRGFAVSGSGGPYSPRGLHLGVYYEIVAGAAEIKAAVEGAVASTLESQRLEIKLAGSDLVRTHSAEVGSRFDVEGYGVEVLRYVPDFVIAGPGKVSSRSEFPHNPALQVRITAPVGSSSEQWLFARYPSMHSDEGALPFEVNFVRSGSDDHISDRVLVIRSPGGEKAVVAHARGGELLDRSEIGPGGTVELEGTGLELTIDRFYENANVLREIQEMPGAGGRAAVEVTVEQGGHESELTLWQDTPVDIPGYRMVYVLEDRIRDFYSVLQIIDGGRVALEKKIEVNDPLRYGGYALYQSSYDSEGQKWSGLQVRKDPGIPLVYAGFSVQILGMIVIFYVNPLIRRAKKAGSQG